MSAGAIRVRVQVDGREPLDGFVDYLRRLGCTLEDRGGRTFDVCVTYPETVDDEAEAIAEWCASWSLAHPPARAIVASAGPAALTDWHAHRNWHGLAVSG